MRAALRFWRYLYGENPLHLLAMVGCFALVGYVVSFVYPGPEDLALLIWFVGAVLAHDLVLYPLYALADQPLVIGRWARRRVLPRRPPLVPAINHVRVPVLGSAVLGLIYFPTITQRGENAFRFTAALGTAGIYRHWLLITGVLFLGSAVVYALRLGAAAGRGVLRRHRAVAAPAAPPGDGRSAAMAPPEDSAPATPATPTAPPGDGGSAATAPPEDPTLEEPVPAASAPEETCPGEPGDSAAVEPGREGPTPDPVVPEPGPNPRPDADTSERS